MATIPWRFTSVERSAKKQAFAEYTDSVPHETGPLGSAGEHMDGPTPTDSADWVYHADGGSGFFVELVLPLTSPVKPYSLLSAVAIE